MSLLTAVNLLQQKLEAPVNNLSFPKLETRLHDIQNINKLLVKIKEISQVYFFEFLI